MNSISIPLSIVCSSILVAGSILFQNFYSPYQIGGASNGADGNPIAWCINKHSGAVDLCTIHMNRVVPTDPTELPTVSCSDILLPPR